MIHSIAALFKRIDNDQEVVDWIRKFSEYKGLFAVIKVGGASIDAPALYDDIATLVKLDLYAPVVYGWGDAFTKKLTAAGIKTEKDEKTGLRITKKQDLPFLEEIAKEQGEKLQNGLSQRGIQSQVLYNIFDAARVELEGVGRNHYTGTILRTRSDDILRTIHEKKIPLIPPLGYTLLGELLNINADTAAKEMVLALSPMKYIIISNVGGVLTAQGELVSRISLAKDYQNLVDNKIISGGMLLKVNEAKEVITAKPHMQIHLSSPQNILEELFTYKGQGTIITM